MEPYSQDFQRHWEQRRARQFQRQDHTTAYEAVQQSGLLPAVVEAAQALDHEELAAHLFHLMINADFVEALRDRATKKLNRPHAAPAAPAPDLIDPAAHDPSRRGDRAGDANPRANEVAFESSDEAQELEDGPEDHDNVGDEADFGGDVNEFYVWRGRCPR